MDKKKKLKLDLVFIGDKKTKPKKLKSVGKTLQDVKKKAPKSGVEGLNDMLEGLSSVQESMDKAKQGERKQIKKKGELKKYPSVEDVDTKPKKYKQYNGPSYDDLSTRLENIDGKSVKRKRYQKVLKSMR